MTNRERLDGEADEGPWALLLAMADECEERGDHRGAAGYRWMAHYRKWPQRTHKKNFSWAFLSWPKRGHGYGNHVLPKDACLLLPGWVNWMVSPAEDTIHTREAKWQRSASSALRAAAEAVGLWLETKRGRPGRP